MRKLRKVLFSTPALFLYICVICFAAQQTIVSTDTLNEAWTKETANNLEKADKTGTSPIVTTDTITAEQFIVPFVDGEMGFGWTDFNTTYTPATGFTGAIPYIDNLYKVLDGSIVGIIGEIDDTAGDGDTKVVYSADKVFDLIADVGTAITWQTTDPTASDTSGLYINTTDGDAFAVNNGVGVSTWTTTYTPVPTAGITDDFSVACDPCTDYTSIIVNRGLVASSGAGKAENGAFGNNHLAYNNTSLGSSNQTIELDITRIGVSGTSGLIARCDGNGTSSTGYYIYPYNGSTGTVGLYSFSGATVTFVDSWSLSQAWADTTTHRIRVTVNASNQFNLFIDWNDDDPTFIDPVNDEGIVTDTTYTTGTYIGVMFYANGSSTLSVDNLEASAL